MEKEKTVNKNEIVKKLLKQEISIDKPITIDVDKQEDKTLTKGEKLADKLSAVAGSWGFIIGFSCFLIFWIILNGILLHDAADPYPFILLNLLLSCLAALQAPIIMMSQNRQAKKDSIRNQNDYQVDLKSELILERLHDQIEEVLKNQKQILKYLENKEEDK